MASCVYHVARLAVKILLFLFTRLKVTGRCNVPGQGPLLVVANHLNLADPPIVAIGLGRKVVFMAKEELFHSRFSRYLVSSLGAFPVHRGQLDREALRQAEQALAGDGVLVMFPEGSRSKNARLQSGHPGSALVAIRSCVPILPVGITGTERIKGAASLLGRPRITVNIGVPFRLPPAEEKLTKAELTEYTDIIMKRIAGLLPTEYRGEYAGKGS